MSSRVNEAIALSGSRLCVGLDPDPQRMPKCWPNDADGMAAFLEKIIDATCDLVCAYKPNLAFFEAMGAEGDRVLRRTLRHIPQGVMTIGDGKRGDVGSTSNQYACALFGDLNVDAATVNPLMGHDCVEPFLRFDDQISFLLCLTSNPGADDFLTPGKLYLRIASMAAEWNERFGNVGLVVGATRADRLAEIRDVAPDLPMLVPGVGAQGGDLEAVVTRGRARDDGEGLIINASRSVIYAGETADNFVDAARAEATRLRDEINDAFRR